MNSIATMLSALIVATAPIAGGFLAGGRYAVSVIQGTGDFAGQGLVYEVDRFTGAISMCSFDGVARRFLCRHSAATDLPETAD
jgi:hypothetical protein